jgi:hypothetical protein
VTARFGRCIISEFDCKLADPLETATRSGSVSPSSKGQIMERLDTASIVDIRRSRTIIRGIQVLVQAMDGRSVRDVAQQLHPNDRAVQDWLTRATSTVTSTATSGISTQTIVNTLVPLLGPTGAAANIFKRCVNLSLGTAAAISLPLIIASGAGVAFINQGSPLPVRQLSFSANPIGPKKLGFNVVMTRELAEGSSAEPLISAVIAADLSLGIESILLDATAADTTRPAGLRNSISTLTADVGTGIDAMFNDLASLAAAVATVGGLNICFIASPKQAIKIALRKSQNAFPFPVYASSALADKMVCALAFDALAVIGDAEPRVEVNKTGAMVMNDVGTEMVTGGVVGTPILSLYQQDLLSLKIIADLNWQLRSSNGFAYITSVNW